MARGVGFLSFLAVEISTVVFVGEPPLMPPVRDFIYCFLHGLEG